MKVSQSGKVIENVLPKDLYASHLEKINGIAFTHREIDIIACILAGRAAKKIASLLSISPKTVENHTRNIMLKLGCRSQESIIDFVEKSKEFLYIKKYYASLLIHMAFELELKKISGLVNKQHPTSCLIVYENEQKDKGSLIHELEKTLKLAGINTSITNQENVKDSSSTDYILYSLSSLVHFESYKNVTSSNTIILLLSDIDLDNVIHKELLDLNCINLTTQKNYYFLAFEMLKKLLPKIDIEKHLSEFKKQHEIFIDPSGFKPSSEKNELMPIEIEATKVKRWIFATSVSCLVIFCFCFGFFTLTKTSTEKLITWNLPRQDHIFVGRENLLKELHTKLHDHKTFSASGKSNALAISACAGLGGIGKTQLALQYVHHAQHPYTLRAWFPAESKDQLHQKYIEFAQSLGYMEEKVSLEKAVIYIKNWLKEHPGWLLVYDNVNSYEEIESLLPEEGGNIIITTRNRDWPNKFEVISIDIMAENESILLLKSLIRRNLKANEENPIKELVKILGYLPLALAQAGAYIHQAQISVADYLSLYKEHEQELLADTTLPKGTQSLSVAVTWNIILKSMLKETNLKNQPISPVDILTACSYMAPEKIPYNLLLSWIKENNPHLTSPEIILSKFIGELWKYSMINKDNNGDITVHRLVQTVVRHQHTLTYEWYNTLLKSADIEFNRETQVLKDEERKRNLLPHLKILLTHYNKEWPTAPKISVAPIMKDVGRIFYIIGDWNTSKSYYERALSILEQYYGQDHPQVADILIDLGWTDRKLGNIKQAKAAAEKALLIYEKHYGKEYFKVALALNCLGDIHQALGDSEKAKKLHEQAVKINEHYYDKEHIEIALTLDLLGRCYGDLGDILRAIETHENVLKIKERHYGKNHASTALTLHYLGAHYRDLGDAKKSKAFHERALKIEEKYYGKEHIRVAFAWAYPGQGYNDLGYAKRAKECLEHALIVEEKYYGGRDDMNMAKTLDELGNAYRKLGDLKKAKAFYERALKIKESYYEKDNYEVALTCSYLTSTYVALNNTKQSKIYLERSLTIINECFYGLNYPEIIETLLELSNTSQSLENHEQAKIQLEQALKIRENYFGQDRHLTKKFKQAISKLEL